MQFFCSSKYAKRKAKLLRRALDKRSRGISYIKCLELTARLFGFATYSALAHIEGFAEYSPFDDEVNDSTLEARFSYQEEVMAASGLADIAGALLDEVNPTGGFWSPTRIPSESEHSMNLEDRLPDQPLSIGARVHSNDEPMEKCAGSISTERAPQSQPYEP